MQTELENTIEASTQNEQKVTEEKGTQKEEALAYAHLVEKATNQKLHNELMQVW